jgi:hypothetical protein
MNLLLHLDRCIVRVDSVELGAYPRNALNETFV